MGVVGSCDEGCGVVGLARSGRSPFPPDRVGVFGTGDKTGVYGLSLAEPLPSSFSEPTAPGVGVFGKGDNAGVQGVGGSAGGKGMFGQGGAGTATGASPGVVGNAGTSAPNDGVQGFGTGTFSGVAGFGDPKGNGTGVFGNGGGPQSAGVRGIGGGGPNTVPVSSAGVYGQAGTGVSGESGNGVGVRATSSSSTGLVAVGTTVCLPAGAPPEAPLPSSMAMSQS